MKKWKELEAGGKSTVNLSVKVKLISWNVRGLNMIFKSNLVKSLIEKWRENCIVPMKQN